MHTLRHGPRLVINARKEVTKMKIEATKAPPVILGIENETEKHSRR